MSVVPKWVIVVVFIAILGGTYALGSHNGANGARLETAKEQLASLEDAAKRERELRIQLETERERLRTVSGKLQDALEGKEIVYVETVKTVAKEVEKPVYRDCIVPASGVRVISEAAARLNATRSAKD